MFFHLTYEIAPPDRDTAQQRFKATGGLPPEGVTMHSRWHSAAGHCGYIIAESTDALAIGKWTQAWTDVIAFEVTPVINDEEAAEMIG